MRSAEILLAWLGYFTLHSLLADSSFKKWVGQRWPQLMPAYRAAFNAIATLSLLPVLWLVLVTESAWLWQWRGTWAWLAGAVQLSAMLGFFVSLRAYDMGEFLGLRQLSQHGDDVPQTFSISFLHRFVRHPWYCLGLALIWTSDMNEPLLISALAITIYFVVGSKLEERKLIAYHGETYRRYMAAVPGLIPLPWKYLSDTAAHALTNRQDRS